MSALEPGLKAVASFLEPLQAVGIGETNMRPCMERAEIIPRREGYFGFIKGPFHKFHAVEAPLLDACIDIECSLRI